MIKKKKFYIIIFTFALTLLGTQESQHTILTNCICIPWKNTITLRPFAVDSTMSDTSGCLRLGQNGADTNLQPTPSWTDFLPSRNLQHPSSSHLPATGSSCGSFPLPPSNTAVLPLASGRAVINFLILTGGKTLASWDLRHAAIAGVLDSGD